MHMSLRDCNISKIADLLRKEESVVFIAFMHVASSLLLLLKRLGHNPILQHLIVHLNRIYTASKYSKQSTCRKESVALIFNDNKLIAT